jgi:hypothetical protein
LNDVVRYQSTPFYSKQIPDNTQIDDQDFVVLDPEDCLAKEEEGDERTEGAELYLDDAIPKEP